MQQVAPSFFELCREFGLAQTTAMKELLGAALAIQSHRDERKNQGAKQAADPDPIIVSRSTLLLAIANTDRDVHEALTPAGADSFALVLGLDASSAIGLARNAAPVEDITVQPTCRQALACYAELWGSQRPLDPIGLGHGIVTAPIDGALLDRMRSAAIDSAAASQSLGRIMGAAYLRDFAFWDVAERVVSRAIDLANRHIGTPDLRSSMLLIAYGQEGSRQDGSSAAFARRQLDRDGNFDDVAEAWLAASPRRASLLDRELRPLSSLMRTLLDDALELAGRTTVAAIAKGNPDAGPRISGLSLLGALLRIVRLGTPPSGAADFIATLFGTSSPEVIAGGMIDGILEWAAKESPSTRDDWRTFFAVGPNTSAPATSRSPYPDAPPTAALHCTEDIQGPDRLGITRHVDAFAMLMASRKLEPPLSIGLFGDWGSGKSFFMRKLRDRIDALAKVAAAANPKSRADTTPSTTSYHSSIVQIEFNAWHYVDTSLWASIVTHIFEQLHAHFTGGEGADERTHWEKLLEKLDEASDLQAEARDELENAKARLAEAQREQDSKQSSLTVAIGGIWAKLLETPELTAAMRELRQVLHGDELDGLRESLLRRREEGGQVLLQTKTFWRSMLQGAGSVRSLGLAVASALAVIALAAVAVYVWRDSDLVKQTAERLGAAIALLTGLSTWVGSIFRRSIGTMKKVGEVTDLVGEQLRQRPEHLATLRQAEVELSSASQAVKESENQLAEVRSQIEGFRPSQRLHSFLADRAASTDYRKHLGLPALIRRDFDRLNRLMRQTFTLEASAAVLAELTAGRVAPAINDQVRKLPDLEFESKEITLTGDAPAQPAVTQSAAPRVEPKPDHSGWIIEDADETRRLDVTRKPGPGGDLLECSLLYRPRIDRIVLYIDDLDRCPPDRVVQVLQAIHLLLTFPLFVVVVGVDARWVSRSLRRQYRELWHDAPESGQRSATPHDYLEKIFQVPFWLRPMNVTSTEDYLDALVGAPRSSPEAEPAVTAPTTGTTTDTGNDADSSGLSSRSVRNTDDDRRAATARDDAGTENAADREPVEPKTDASAAMTTTSVELTPPQLELGDAERLVMRRLAAIHGRSPRAVKRLVNIYFLIRAGLGDQSHIDAYVAGKEHETVLFLLSVIVGAPFAALTFCQLITERPDSEGLADFAHALASELHTTAPEGFDHATGIETDARPTGTSTRTEADGRPRTLAHEIDALRDQLIALDGLRVTVASMKRWLDEVRRFSFRVG
ncbi:MAG: hypothetical protein KDC98_09660 [Planctomycetes bacterium]|nr:hypothetical protein [Planctomycetota bacterium]